MKNIFKKNHIIITALAIMIVIAGYLSFSNKDTPEDPDSTTTMGNSDTTTYDEFTSVDGMDVATDTTGTTTDTNTTTGTDTTGTGTDTTGTTTDTNTTTDTTTDTNTTADPSVQSGTSELGQNDIADDDIMDTAQDVTDNGELDLEDGVPGEAVLANATIDSSYFISTKLDREQVRAKNKETLMSIIESPDISEEDKQTAINTMIELTEIAEKESSAEMLLEAKGFDGAVVFIVDDQVNVVVNASNLSDQQLAIIEDIVKGETDIPVNNIHINPVVVED